MLTGWYCRTMANEQAQEADHADHTENDDGNGESDESDEGIGIQKLIDYKIQYQSLKKKLKFLLYENEFFQDALRSSQRRLLKVTRDKSFLLDRLLQYEKPDITSSESDETETSDDENSRVEPIKKRKIDSSNQKNSHTSKRKKPPPKKQNFSQLHGNLPNVLADGHMTAEEVERHLQSRQSFIELVPEKAPPTVPTEMFSNEPSLDSESNDQMIETSPSNMGEDCLSVDMN